MNRLYPVLLLLALTAACDSRGFTLGMPPAPVIVVSGPPSAPLWGGMSAPLPRAAHEAQGIAITPITSVTAGASGLAYSGDAYEIGCTVSGTVTLYPALYDSTLIPPAWVIYQQYGCALASSVATEGACIFPGRLGVGQTFNALQTGTGTVASCTAQGRAGVVPASPSTSAGGGGGSGTVTSVGLALPPQFVVSGSPVTTSGTLTGTWATQAPNLVLAGPLGGSAPAAPTFRALVAADIPALATLTPGTGLSGSGYNGTAAQTFAVSYGTSAGTATQGNDNRLNPAPAAAGRILYDTGSAWAAIAAGSPGQVLQSSGAGAPLWAASTSSLQQLVQQIPGLSLYIDAGCFSTTDGQPLVGNSTMVPDLSGRGNAFQVIGSGLEWTANGLGTGLPAFYFSDGASYLQGPSSGNLIAPGDAPAGVLAVVNFTSLTATPVVLEVGHDHFTNLQTYQFTVLPAGAIYVGNFGGGNERGTADGVVGTGSPLLVGWQVSSGAFSSGNPTFSLGGGAQASTQGSGTSVPNIVYTTSRIGANLSGSPAQILTGYLAVLILWNGPHSSQVDAVITALKAKYGV